jgi:hypothetical protein
MGWHNIKVDRADQLFSRYVRLRDKECLKCHRRGGGEYHIQGLQCSHFYGRRKESTRFDLLNADSLCAGCHKWFTEHKTEYEAWKLERLGQKEYDLLMLRSNTPAKKDRKLQAMIWKELLKKDFNYTKN